MLKKKKGKVYEERDLENEYSGDCQHSDSSTDGTRNDLVYGDVGCWVIGVGGW